MFITINVKFEIQNLKISTNEKPHLNKRYQIKIVIYTLVFIPILNIKDEVRQTAKVKTKDEEKKENFINDNEEKKETLLEDNQEKEEITIIEENTKTIEEKNENEQNNNSNNYKSNNNFKKKQKKHKN